MSWHELHVLTWDERHELKWRELHDIVSKATKMCRDW
jgi:hypothetical protein